MIKYLYPSILCFMHLTFTTGNALGVRSFVLLYDFIVKGDCISKIEKLPPLLKNQFQSRYLE